MDGGGGGEGWWDANDGYNSPYRECYCTLTQLDLHFKGNKQRGSNMHLTDRSGIKNNYKSAHYVHNKKKSFFFFSFLHFIGKE